MEAARAAHRRITKMKSLVSLPNIRLYVLILAVVTLAWWVYTNYFQPKVVKIAVVRGEYALLRDQADRNNVDNIEFVESDGSPANVELLRLGRADMAVVQGGVQIPGAFTNLGVVRSEHVLFFVRDTLVQKGTPPAVITFGEEQGSHILGKIFFGIWGYPEVEWIHSWREFATSNDYVIPTTAQAIFVVVDPAEPMMRAAVRQVGLAGFRLRDPDIGVYATSRPYLKRIAVDRGYYHLNNPTVPDIISGSVHTYAVDNYLVAAQSLSEHQLVTALQAFELNPSKVGLAPTVLHSRGSSVIEDLANLLAVTVNVVVIMIALFGVELLVHRRYIHELNSLVSSISLLQADVDLIGVGDKKTLAAHTLCLDACADLLGLISTIAGYYGQEKAALVFGGLTGSLHARANDIKINIRLKLLHTGSVPNFV